MAQKKRDKAEIEAVRAALPLTPPPDVIETVKGRMKAALLVYRAAYATEPLTGLKKKVVRVTCTSCGQSTYLPYVSGYGCHCGYGQDAFGFLDPADKEPKYSGSTCICPACGTGAEALHIGRICGTRIIEKGYMLTNHNVRGHFAALGFVLYRECDKNGNVFDIVRRYEGIAVIGGRTVRYTGYYKGMGYNVTFTPEWNARAVWRDNADTWNREEIFFDKDAFFASEAANSALDVYIRDVGQNIRIGAYLQLWTKHRQIENPVRCGLAVFVSRVIDKATHNDGYYGVTRVFSIKDAELYFDFKRKKPHEMLGLDKKDLMRAKEWDPETMRFYRLCRGRNIRLTDQDVTDVVKIGIVPFADLLRRSEREGFVPPVLRTLHYLTRQMARHKDTVGTTFLLDYWDMIRGIQGRLPEELQFPKDLVAAHNAAVLRRKEKTDPKIDGGITAFAKTLTRLSFSDEDTGFLIRPVHDQSELIKEGAFLHHCVGTYAAAVSQRKTSIFLIRRIEAPDIPFYTLEYRDGSVAQNRGYKNCARTEEVRAFEEKWLAYIQNDQKEISKYGKRTAGETRQRAGA